MIRWKKEWGEQPETLPVDVMPCSNDEFLPPAPMKHHIQIMDVQRREVDRLARKMGMSRRHFVRTSAGMAVGFWAIDAVKGGQWGNYAAAHNTKTLDACDLEWATAKGLDTVMNLPGEFVFDIQSHHVDPEGDWRVTNPAMHAFFAALWPQSSMLTGGRPGRREDGSLRGGGAGEIEPMDNLSAFHYFKELFLDSATSMTVLSCTPTSPDTDNPLPLAKAAHTVHAANGMAGIDGSKGKEGLRSIMHAFVMPNRGSAGMTQDNKTRQINQVTGAGVQGPKPLYFDAEMQQMWERAEQYESILGGWKTYCAWGDVPYASGWQLDSDYGMEFLENVAAVSRKFPGVPPVVATHKGFALPGFDQRGAAPRDVGVAARANPEVRFMIYHSGYDIFESGVPVGGDREGPYPADDSQIKSTDRSVNAFIKSLRENHWSAEYHKQPGQTFGNVPNVWAELGSVWREHISDPNACVHLLGKLITHVGPKRIAWGTDSLWYGSPHREIVALRRLQFTEQAKTLYKLPYGLDGDVEDPTQPAPDPSRTIRNGILGRNAALAYNIDPDAARARIACDAVNGFRETEYLDNVGTPSETVPMRENTLHGARTRGEVLKGLVEGPWTP